MKNAHEVGTFLLEKYCDVLLNVGTFDNFEFQTLATYIFQSLCHFKLIPSSMLKYMMPSLSTCLEQNQWMLVSKVATLRSCALEHDFNLEKISKFSSI